MDTSKLFHVLVMGGALIAAGCSGGKPAPADHKLKPDPHRGGGTSSGTTDKKEPRLVFCAPDNPRFCSDGVPRTGIACCWNTNC